MSQRIMNPVLGIWRIKMKTSKKSFDEYSDRMKKAQLRADTLIATRRMFCRGELIRRRHVMGNYGSELPEHAIGYLIKTLLDFKYVLSGLEKWSTKIAYKEWKRLYSVKRLPKVERKVISVGDLKSWCEVGFNCGHVVDLMVAPKKDDIMRCRVCEIEKQERDEEARNRKKL